MKWRFSCHKCGKIFTMEHRAISKDKWLSGKKEGRPMLECIHCPDYRSVKIVGDLVGNRS